VVFEPMKRFELVRQILERSVGGKDIFAHGNFWRALSLQEFISKSVFGLPLVKARDAANSNLIHALRGRKPFGADLSPRPPGARYRRMPAGKDPVPERDIVFIERWIDDGCPDEEIEEVRAFAEDEGLRTLAREDEGLGKYVTFFRSFDYFFMYDIGSHPETGSAIGEFFGIGEAWPGWNLSFEVKAWSDLVSLPQSRAPILRLSEDQLRIMRDFFGDPMSADELNLAFWHFGRGTLPLDELRPSDKKHQMNGTGMWLSWLAFADAAIRTDTEPQGWETVGRAVALGMVGDSLFRADRAPNERLRIVRYKAGQPRLKETIIGDLAPLKGEQLLARLIDLSREAWGADAIS
jgi:hypothetical protein